MTAYGSYNAVRNFFRGLMAFIGGLLAAKTSLAITGIIMASYPAILLLYTLFVFKEERKMVFFAGAGHFKSGFYYTFKALLYPMVIFPLLFNLLPGLPPSPGTYWVYMLLGEGGWSFNLYVTVTFISSLVTSIMLGWFVSAVKTMSFYNLQFYGNLIGVLAVYGSTINLFCQYFNPYFFAVIYFMNGFLLNLGGNIQTVSLIGRISKYLPEGFESTGITLMISSFNAIGIINGYISTPFLQQFNIHAGYYRRVRGPQIFSLISSIVFILLSPLFLMWG